MSGGGFFVCRFFRNRAQTGKITPTRLPTASLPKLLKAF